MDISEQTRLLKASKEVHRNWYVNAYPDVAALGLDPARHYLLYGAAMGRNPGKGFDTRFYLERYPEVLESGMNPLLHYILLGRDRNYMPRPEREADPLAQVGQLRTKLLSLGFTERPLEELGHLSEHGQHPRTRASASRELALWYMREKTAEGYEKALGLIARARADAESLDMRSKLATVEILCHHLLARRDNGLMAYQRAAVAGEVTPDVMLAAVNLFDEEYARVAWINQVLKRFGISALKLLPDGGEAPYDRLAGAEDLPVVTDGPLVTVLLAAYEAADTLPTALRSLQEQTWRNLEILVLDDCSPTPGTAEVAERFAAADPRIRLIHMEQNGGAYVARNRGLDEAVGEFVTIHDADDWSHPQKIETQVRLLLDNPQIMGCTTQQARATEDLGFFRLNSGGNLINLNTSSFMFRRREVMEGCGRWDTVRFGADTEMMKRVRAVFGRNCISKISDGVYSFQRISGSSIVGNAFFGIEGFEFGARLAYYEAYRQYHLSQADLNYRPVQNRPFATPNVMVRGVSASAEARKFDVIIGSEFRMAGGSTRSNIEEMRCHEKYSISHAHFHLNRYDYMTDRSMFSVISESIDTGKLNVLTYGESASCDLLILRYPPSLQHLQRYVPRIDAKDIRVIVNQTPMSDYGPEGVMRFDIATCAANIRTYFGKDATWHPIGPLVRDALTTHHAADLGKVKLSDVDWQSAADTSSHRAASC